MVIITTWHTAPQEFVCSKCGSTIAVGDSYKSIYCSVREKKVGSYIKAKCEKYCKICATKYKFSLVEVGNENIQR